MNTDLGLMTTVLAWVFVIFFVEPIPPYFTPLTITILAIMAALVIFLNDAIQRTGLMKHKGRSCPGRGAGT